MEWIHLTNSGKIMKKDLGISEAANSGTLCFIQTGEWELKIDFQIQLDPISTTALSVQEQRVKNIL